MKENNFIKFSVKPKKIIRVSSIEKGVKEDLNFLEFPTAILDDKNACLVFELETSQGSYEIGSILGLPTSFDKRVWFFLLHKLHKDGLSEERGLILTRHEIAKNVIESDRKPSSSDYKRIMFSLKKWSAISIDFNGLFYMNGKHYSRMFYHMLDEVRVDDETEKLHIHLNNSYLSQIQNSNHYAIFNFEEYRKLSNPTAARLYELFVKNFQHRSLWNISLDALAVKMPLAKRKRALSYYPSDIVPLIERGIKEINEKTSLKISFNFNKQKGVCIFNGQILRSKPNSTQEMIQPAVKDTLNIENKILRKESALKTTKRRNKRSEHSL